MGVFVVTGAAVVGLVEGESEGGVVGDVEMACTSWRKRATNAAMRRGRRSSRSIVIALDVDSRLVGRE